MPLPFPPNTTCDIYRSGNTPPAVPDVASVPCLLSADYQRRNESGEGDAAVSRFTHILLVALDTDIRDDYNAGAYGGLADTIYVPDKNGTPFFVRFVEVRSRGTPGAHKKAYLDRLTAPWPTNNL